MTHQLFKRVLGLALCASMLGPAAAKDSIRVLEAAAARGVAGAQNDLGWRYHTGDGVERDDRRALELLRAAASQGNPSGLINLGYFYQEGIVVTRDKGRAADLYEKAANAGCAPLPRDAIAEWDCRSSLRGKVNLALMLAVGDGRPKNLRSSAALLREAISAGYADSDAKAALASILLKGEEVPADPPAAVALLKELAAAGDTGAALDLGTVYHRGAAGVPMDLREALRWYLQAAPKEPRANAAAAELSVRLLSQKSEADPRKAGDPTAYAASLKAKYGNRIHYETGLAKRVVQDFAIDCQAPDGRVLPLENAMLAKLASMDAKNNFLAARVESRGEDVRIYDQLIQGGVVVHTNLAFEINKWGELRSPAGKLTALRNACFGSYGPIWKAKPQR